MANDPETTRISEDKRVDSLEDRIEAAKKAEGARLAKEHGPMREGSSSGIRVVSTMVGYPLGGILIGLFLDNVLDTLPWITIGLMFLAFAGACIHVIRMLKNPAE